MELISRLEKIEGLYGIQNRLCMAISWLILSIFLANVGLGLEDNFGIAQKGISICLKILTLMICVWALWRPVLSSPALAVLITAFFVPLALLSALLQPDNIYFQENIIMFFVFSFPIMIISFYVVDQECLLYYLRKTALFMGYACLMMLLLFTQGVRLFSLNYSMGLSYSLLLPLLVLLEKNFENFENKEKRYIIATISILLTILIFGSRGAILCVLCYMLFLAIKHKKWSILRHIFIPMLICSIFFYFFGEKLMLCLAENNVQARSLMLFSKMKEQGVNTSGREYIYANAVAGINEAPFIFKGMFASYPLNGNYPHNIVLEAWYDLGIFSILLFGTIAWAVFKTFCDKSESSKLELILLSYCIGLLVSGTFWLSPYFWMWLIMALKSNTDCLIK